MQTPYALPGVFPHRLSGSIIAVPSLPPGTSDLLTAKQPGSPGQEGAAIEHPVNRALLQALHQTAPLNQAQDTMA